MRHRVVKRHLSRDTKHRSSLLKNLLRALFEHGSIVTTLVKAKETKRQAEKLIAKAQKNDVSTKRRLHGVFGKRDVVNTLVEKIAPLFSNQGSGFSHIELLGKRRGDNALLVKLSLIKQPEQNKTLKASTNQHSSVQKSKVATKVAKDKKPADKKNKVLSPKKKSKA